MRKRKGFIAFIVSAILVFTFVGCLSDTPTNSENVISSDTISESVSSELSEITEVINSEDSDTITPEDKSLFTITWRIGMESECVTCQVAKHKVSRMYLPERENSKGLYQCHGTHLLIRLERMNVCLISDMDLPISMSR